MEDVEPRHCLVREPVALVYAAEKPPLGVTSDPAALINALKTWMAGHLVPLAAFLVKPQPYALSMLEKVSDPHRHRRSHPGETVDHDSDQGSVTDPDQ